MQDIADMAGFETKVFREGATAGLSIFSAYRRDNTVRDGVVDIFIEGDGYAWVDRRTISDNPTPLDPVSLRLATKQLGPVYYLARPCQYVSDPSCTPSLWTYDRFSPAVIDSYMGILDRIAKEDRVHEFHITGFSGGAYIAFVLAAKRQDIARVTTVAGVLDPDDWTRFHGISALRVTDSPDVLLQHTSSTVFTHICGEDDDVTPCPLTHKIVERAAAMGFANHTIRIIKNAGHGDLWRSVYKMPR